MITKIQDLELETFHENDVLEMPPADIIAYNELRSCADLFRMYTQDILEIKPEYQREVVWKDPAQTKFIDSLIKQLPIPSMCFSLDYKTQKWQVIDGLQRMWTIIRFLSGTNWTLSKLEDIDQNISGQAIEKFVDRNSELHKYYLRVENLSLPVTILRCDYSKKNHQDYIFTIFHRLNSGGARLTNQEIRNCIYGGTFNKLLKSLNENQTWMKINKIKSTYGHRFIQEEIILRFFAFYDRYQEYNGRLAKFLNDYMDVNRNPKNSFLLSKRLLFERTINLVYKSVFEGKPPKKLSTSILEGILVGVALNIKFLESQPVSKIKAMYDTLLATEEFSEKKLREGIAGKERVIKRMNTARRVFYGRLYDKQDSNTGQS
jgi:uncharacterized protein with ParB-like and HNH nuclease domain